MKQDGGLSILKLNWNVKKVLENGSMNAMWANSMHQLLQIGIWWNVYGNPIDELVLNQITKCQ
jgi:hypothetical protein